MSDLLRVAMTYGIISIPLGVALLIASDFFDDQAVWLVPTGLLLVGPSLMAGLIGTVFYAITVIWA